MKYIRTEDGIEKMTDEQAEAYAESVITPEQKISALQRLIEKVDKKIIRAICEPSIKDEETGETWLDFFNKEVQNLRNEITKLGE